jgi:hypothetical protein
MYILSYIKKESRLGMVVHFYNPTGSEDGD